MDGSVARAHVGRNVPKPIHATRTGAQAGEATCPSALFSFAPKSFIRFFHSRFSGGVGFCVPKAPPVGTRLPASDGWSFRDQ